MNADNVFEGGCLCGAIAEWWSAHGTFMRACAALPVIFGFFIIYAVTPRRQAA
ncbi:hypothetical protein [Pseudomonas sp. 2FE]|uniref:hypothetical protein n=1 Tax=Pseudomonas sp. 2FE TaxID=2502190 RepID=UPI0014852A92|nr:hypothetical protein [Pseudomonas sp. 2FE]